MINTKDEKDESSSPEIKSVTVNMATPAQPAPKPNHMRSSFKNLFAFTRPAHVSLLVTALCGSALIAAGRTAYAVLLGKIFEVCTSYGSGAIEASDMFHQVSKWCLYMFLLGVGMWVSCSIDVAIWVMAGELRVKTTRETLFETLLNRSAAWFDLREHGMSSLMTTIQTQARELQMGASQVFGFLVCDLLVFGSCIIVALYYSWKLTLVMLSTAVPSAIILWFIARYLDPAIAGQKRELAEAAKHATAATTAIDLVKAYNAADHESFNFVSAIRRSTKYYIIQVLSNNGQMSYIKLWMMSLFVLGFYFAVVLVNREELTPGNALTTFYCALISFQSLQNLGPQWLILAKGMAAGQSLQELVRQIVPGQPKSSNPQASGNFRPATCNGDIALQNISFAYPASPTNVVLHPSSFHFPSGSLTFIVGRSGSGKSTLGNLLVRFYEPLSGSITVDGTPINSLDLQWLRQNITLIQQTSSFFNATLFQNVAFGSHEPDSVTTEEVKEAISMALLQTTVSGMPDGLDTQIGPGGYSLSGGQRQRLALARAKIRDPKVLILDEITSGLDPVSRGLIMDALRIWRKGKTTIIITHEVGCIDDEEMVYVMEGGKVVQRGRGGELKEEKEGLFAGLVGAADRDGFQSQGADEEMDEEEDSELDDIEEMSDEEKIEEGTYVQLARGLSLHSNRGSMVYPRLTFGYHSSENNRESRPLSRRLSTGRPHHLHPHAERIRAVSRFARDNDDRRHSTSSIELITQTGLSIKTTRVSNAQRAQHPDPSSKVIETQQLNSSLDSLELFFLEKLANKKQRAAFHKKRRNSISTISSSTSNKKKHSAANRLPSLYKILLTVFPTLDIRTRIELCLGLISCLVAAAANPLFSYVFAQLLSSFWSSPSARLAAGSRYAGILAAIAVVDALSTFFAYYLLERVATRWVTTLRSEAISRILAQPKSWFDKPSHSPAKIVACLDRNAEEMRKLVGMFLPILVIVSSMITIAIAWAMSIQWDLTLVTLAGIPAAVITGQLNAAFSDKWESRCDLAAVATGSVLSETFGNIKIARALTLESFFTAKYYQKVEDAYRLGRRRATYVGLFFGLNQSIAYYLTAMIFYYGAKILSGDRASVTDLLRVINLILFSLGSCVTMLGNVPQIAAAKATATQMLYFASLEHGASHESEGRQRVENPLPIRMRELRFAYPSAPETLGLRNLNLEIREGECLAVVGASGSGKSTVASLLLGLYPPLPPSGSPAASPFSPSSSSSPSPSPVPLDSFNPPATPFDPETRATSLTYNSIPASSIHTQSLRSQIGYIPQHPLLLPTTLRANILYGLPDSSPLRLPSAVHHLHRAAQLASIHDFIVSLPDGYDTVVGEGSGLQLSGGQAQRVSIARALVRSPKVIVADEPTASLDAEGAEAVREVFARLVHENKEGMAIVVITHSKEMMRIADRVVMIENGTVVEEGPYDVLAAKRGGRFAGMVSGGAWDGSSAFQDNGHGHGADSGRRGQQRGHKRNATLATIASEFGGESLGESSSSARYGYGYGSEGGGAYAVEDEVSELSDEDDYEKPRTGAGAGVRVNEEALSRLEGTSPDSSTEESEENQATERGRGTYGRGEERGTWGWRFD